ncbi:MAG: calcium/sodium antiporter [Burkholderiaceae bacterium]|nr:calcium/sodium antiporter [Burkholderiaceae bacterium]
MPPTALFLVGIALVLLGAEFVLRGASRLAALLGVSPMLVGLTIVSVGTSTPELAVGITAAAEGRGTLAVGNIAGANILNLLFILGLSALIRPLPVRLRSIRLDVPVMIASAIGLIAISWDGMLGRFDGSLLLAAALAYTVALVVQSRRETAATKREFAREFGVAAAAMRPGPSAALRNLALLAAGIAIVVWGADLLVAGAADIARALGVSDAIIGLTIVSIGTTAPELATTVVATLKNDRDVAIGNLIGSSVYNILAILGAVCVAAPAGVEVGRDILLVDLPLAAAAVLACVSTFVTDRKISRREGALLIGLYLVYLGWLVLVRA